MLTTPFPVSSATANLCVSPRKPYFARAPVHLSAASGTAEMQISLTFRVLGFAAEGPGVDGRKG